MLSIKDTLLETAQDIFKRIFHLNANTIVNIDDGNTIKSSIQEKAEKKKINKKNIQDIVTDSEITRYKSIEFSFDDKKGTMLFAMNDAFVDVLEQHIDENVKKYFSFMDIEELIASIFGIILYTTHTKFTSVYDTLDFSLPVEVKQQALHTYDTVISYGASKTQTVLLLSIAIL